MTPDDVMISPVAVVAEDAPVIEAIRRKLKCGVKRLPVVDINRRLVGMVDRERLLRAVVASGETSTVSSSLNPSQLRAVQITLAYLDQELHHFEQILKSDEEGILYRVVTELPEDLRQAFLALVEQARAEIARVKEQFGLAVDVQDGRRIIVGTLAVLWSSLEDRRPERLKGFGSVSPEAIEQLGPSMDRIIRIVWDMQSLAANSAPRAESDDER